MFELRLRLAGRSDHNRYVK